MRETKIKVWAAMETGNRDAAQQAIWELEDFCRESAEIIREQVYEAFGDWVE